MQVTPQKTKWLAPQKPRRRLPGRRKDPGPESALQGPAPSPAAPHFQPKHPRTDNAPHTPHHLSISQQSQQLGSPRNHHRHLQSPKTRLLGHISGIARDSHNLKTTLTEEKPYI